MSIKKLVLLMALALTALAVSAGSASATIVDTTGPYTGPITGNLEPGTSAVLTTGSSTVTCTASDFTGTVDDPTNSGPNDNGAITAVTFSSCIFNNTATESCTASVTNEPLNFRVDKDPPDGTLVITENVAATVICLGFVTCEVTAAAGVVTADLDSANDTATFNENLATSGFGCGSQGTWTAVYTVNPTDLRTQ